MRDIDIPDKFPAAWAWDAADPAFVRSIPITSQIGINDGFASLPDGFPPLTFVPEGSGGIPPFGQDTNGILRQITEWALWMTANPVQPYDGTWQTAIGGYNKGAVVESAVNFGVYWLSTTNNNVTNPDTGGAGWVTWSPGGVKNYVVDTGSANALVATPSPPLGAYADGVTYLIDPAHANTTASTLNVSVLGALPIVHTDGTGIGAGEIQAGQLMQVAVLGSNFVWLNAPYFPTRSPGDNSNFPADTAYVDAATLAVDNYSGNLVGLITSNTPSFTTTRITIATGKCRDSTNAINMALVAPITKSLTAAWAAGNNNGGRDTGSLANGQSWYVFIIYNPTSHATDAIFSQSATAPTLPSGYTFFRRVGSLILEAASTAVHQFIQIGQFFEYFLRSADYAVTANGGGVAHYRTVSVPLGIKTKARFYFQSTGTASTATFLSGVYDPDLGVPPAFGTPTQWAQIRRGAFLDSSSTAVSYGTVVFDQYTDNASSIYTFSSDTSDVIALGVVGYEDIGLNRFF